MNNTQSLCVLTLRLRHERHVVHARQRARDIAALLGFEHQEQIRLATAASELARNAFRYASNATVEFLISDTLPQMFILLVTDSGPGIADLAGVLDGRYISKTGMGKGITGTKRLMDHFQITSSPQGTRVEAGKVLPPGLPPVNNDTIRRIASELAKSGAVDPFDEVERQNQELLKTLAELREKQEQLNELNHELEDTNRGVVALYAELDQHAEDLRRVSDLKTSFLSNLSHEFRTPLNSITSLSRMLSSRVDGELTAEQEKQVKYIERSATELTDLVNDLLDLAKVESGKIDIRPVEFDVQEMFATLRGMLKPLSTNNALELIFDSPPDLSPLFTDEGKLSQILRNLISNALKFTTQGHVRVSAQEVSNGMMNFRVTDTGIGIALEDQQRIFEEFEQVHSEMQTRVKGTGLGLPLSRRLAELLGGTIGVASEMGRGSTFTVTIPAYFGKPSPRPPSISLQKTASRTILFIEDDEETRVIHEASLRNSHYRLVFASNVSDARAAMKLSAPAAVAMDRFLEGQDSLPYVQEMRARGYTGPLVVISNENDPDAAINAGADAFLLKPVMPLTLANTLRDLIDGRSLKSVLLVDDDEVTRYLVAESLVKLGYRILEAHSGREAIRLAHSHIPNLMFLDIVMPDLNGFEVLREIRSSPSTQAIPVIVHTSKDLTEKEMAYLREMNAVFYAKKSFGGEGSTESLLSILAAAGMEK